MKKENKWVIYPPLGFLEHAEDLTIESFYEYLRTSIKDNINNEDFEAAAVKRHFIKNMEENKKL